ncbi:MAG: hypothetical protein ISS56_18130 [Anaerolineae bacterium]|nr:hypothetical protein [Anaerolineae bacterium]
MLGVLVSQLIAEHRIERALFLTTRVELQMQSLTVLRRYVEDIPVIEVDAQSYRQLQASVELGVSPWSEPVLAVANIDFTKREHIAESLVEVEWDLIVVHDAQRLVGLRKSLVQRLMDRKAPNRLLLVSGITPGTDAFDFVPDLQIIEWKHDVVDWDGNPLFTTLREQHVITYNRTEEEKALLNDLTEFLRQMSGPGASLQRSLLLRAASSSLYALERSLRRRRNRLAHGMPLDHSAIDEDLLEAASLARVSAEGADLEDASLDLDGGVSPDELGIVESLIEGLDRIPSDTKLQALISLMERLASRDSSSRVCIFASLAATVSYLYSSLKETRPDVYQLAGSMSHEERVWSLHQFAETGGVLIVSSACLTGLDLAEVDIGINYDLPPNPIEMERRWALIARPRRTSPCIMYAFRDGSATIPFEEKALRLSGFSKKR